MDVKGCMFSSMLKAPSVHLYTLELSICDPIGGVAFEFPHTKGHFTHETECP